MKPTPIAGSNTQTSSDTNPNPGSNSDEPLKVSVVVPVCNVEEYLNDCVNCILQSSYRNLEVILVDDGSTDNSYEICEQFVNKDSRVKLIRSSDDGENMGTATTKNIGLAAVTGDAVHFCDADDYVQKDFYSLLVNSMIENQADIVVGSVYHEKTNHTCFVPPLLYLGVLGRLSCNLGLKNKSYAYLLNKRLLREYDLIFPLSRYGEDNVFVTQALHRAKRVSSVPKGVYYHRYHSKDVLENLSLEEKFSWQQYTDTLLDVYAREFIPKGVWETYQQRNKSTKDFFSEG